MKADPKAFRDALVIDLGGGKGAFLGKVAEPWQREAFDALDPAWLSIIGKGPPDPVRRAYLERARGHSKTTDIAAMVTWLLFAADRKVTGIATAADKDQAKLLRDGIDTVVRLNPWLSEILTVNKYGVYNVQTGSELQIIATDDGSAYGHTVDFIICDELTHWDSEEMFTAAFSTAAKRPTCLFVIISNAGMAKGLELPDMDGVELGGSWHWRIREAARKSEDWFFQRLDGAVASWITEKTLADQRTVLTGKSYARLWLNQWQTEGGEGLSMEDVMACCVRPGPIEKNRGEFVAICGGLDLAQTHHHAAFVAIGCDIGRQRLVLVETQRWRPADFDGGRISLTTVENDVMEICKRLGLAGIVYDPWQCERSAEELERRGIKTFRYPPNPKNGHEMAKEVLHSFRVRDVELYPEPTLLKDLQRIQIVERSLGYKLTGPEDEEDGHCDMATALALVLPFARATMIDYTANQG